MDEIQARNESLCLPRAAKFSDGMLGVSFTALVCTYNGSVALIAVRKMKALAGNVTDYKWSRKQKKSQIREQVEVICGKKLGNAKMWDNRPGGHETYLALNMSD